MSIEIDRQDLSVRGTSLPSVDRRSPCASAKMNNSLGTTSISSSLNASSFLAKVQASEQDAKLVASGLCDDIFVELFQTNTELTIRSFNASTYKAHLLDRYVGNVRKTETGLTTLAKRITGGRFLVKPDSDEKNILLEVGEDVFLLYPHTGANHERLHIRLLQHRIHAIQRPDDASFFQQGRTTAAQWLPGESARTLICVVGFHSPFKSEPHVIASLINPSETEFTKMAVRSVSTVGFMFEITLPRSVSPEFASSHALTVAWMASTASIAPVSSEAEESSDSDSDYSSASGSDSSDGSKDEKDDSSGSESDSSSDSS